MCQYCKNYIPLYISSDEVGTYLLLSFTTLIIITSKFIIYMKGVKLIFVSNVLYYISVSLHIITHDVLVILIRNIIELFGLTIIIIIIMDINYDMIIISEETVH